MTTHPRRLSGPDALMLHMERPDVPMHTLKVLVLDPSRLGRALTLADVRSAIEPRLGLVPWATQRLASGATYGGRPFWVDDHAFDLDAHLEDTVTTDLDEACARLAERHLDRTRPLWALTLVSGLPDGRQALVVRLHHAVADGIAALNSFLAATHAEGELPVEPISPLPGPPAARRDLRRLVRHDLATAPRAAARTIRATRTGRRAATEVEGFAAVPAAGPAHPRNSLSRPSGGARVCASASLELAALKGVAKAAGVTLNGALHAVIAGALREELLERGDDVGRPAVATFGVAADAGSKRLSGNEIAATSAHLHVDLVDPLARLAATADSCRAAVAVRRARGFELTNAMGALAPRLVPSLRDLAAARTPWVNNHITTANVAGPTVRRWLGPVEVVDWISYAVAVAPADVNLTVYSYAGRLSLGLVATPESMPEPARFLGRVEAALHELVGAVAVEGVACPSRI